MLLDKKKRKYLTRQQPGNPKPLVKSQSPHKVNIQIKNYEKTSNKKGNQMLLHKKNEISNQTTTR